MKKKLTNMDIIDLLDRANNILGYYNMRGDYRRKLDVNDYNVIVVLKDGTISEVIAECKTLRETYMVLTGIIEGAVRLRDRIADSL